jgi:hypothetical protein
MRAKKNRGDNNGSLDSGTNLKGFPSSKLSDTPWGRIIFAGAFAIAFCWCWRHRITADVSEGGFARTRWVCKTCFAHLVRREFFAEP